MALQRVLITGAAGNLGRVLRQRLRGSFPVLRLSDRDEMPPAEAGEEVVRCDLADAEAVKRLCEGVDAILHFGGRSLEGSWPQILSANIAGGINLWEGARLAGVERVVFASSNHVVGLYRRTEKFDHTVMPRPDGRYGISKAFGEDLASLYAYKHGIKAFCMRIGSCFEKPTNKRMLSTWLSFADFERLIRVGLTADYLFEIVYGQSRNTRSFWDNSNAYRLGYNPQDNAEAFAPEVEDKVSGNPLSDELQGGDFVPPDFSGNLDKL
jgi:uronate dehydrogenase